jgi:hypothetical protein
MKKLFAITLQTGTGMVRKNIVHTDLTQAMQVAQQAVDPNATVYSATTIDVVDIIAVQ